MMKLGKKLISALMALVICLTLAPAAGAEGTALKVEFTGMYATRMGEYEAIRLSGTFEVYQEDQLVGTLDVTPDGENTIALPSAADVHLVPVMSTIPREIPLSAYGYALAVAADRLNIAPLNVRANAGLFVVEAGYQADFVLLDGEAEVLTFSTDATGHYALKHAIAVGEYVLRMTAAQGELWQDQTMEIVKYAGEESVLRVENPNPAPAFTAVPVTQAPTLAPTEVPTAAPTATPVPTATPTTAPTATPVPTEGTLIITAHGGDAALRYSVATEADTVAQGSLSQADPVELAPLKEGEYLVTLQLPEGVVMTALNGNETIQREAARWMAVVDAMQESVYTVEISRTGALVVPFAEVKDAQITLSGAQENRQAQHVSETWQAEELLPGNYTVSVTVKKAQYQYDAKQWQLSMDAQSMTFTAQCTVKGGETTALTPITRVARGSVSGKVTGMDGKALKGVEVTVQDGNGKVISILSTDKNGAWGLESLPFGEYTVRYAYEGVAIPSSLFTLGDEHSAAILESRAAKPAKVTVRVFMDENNNGSSGKGEGFVKDVEVALVTPDGAVADTARTDKNGYATLHAPAGSYHLRASVAAGYGFSKQGDGINLTNNIMEESSERTVHSALINLSTERDLEVGVGVQELAKVSGTVWNDLNADGIWQKDEPGIPGIRVTIRGGRNGDFFETVTDENGYYELTQIKKGNYTLTCHVPDAWVFTVKAKGKNDVAKISRMTTEADRAGEDELSLDRGEVHADHNIGMMAGAIIEGVCFLDANGNGIFDEGEKPLPGVEMRLARQSNNVKLQETVSDENGVYHFYGQRGSTFTIRANLPKGYVFTVTAAGENGNRFAPNGTKTERRLTDVTLENGEYRQLMLGAVSFGSISGRVYYDEDFSAKWEKGEKLGEEMLVTLLDANGEKVVARKTDGNGNYSFADLKPGDYTLRITPAKGYAFTALGSGNVMKTQPDGTGLSRVIPLGMGEDLKGIDAGMILPATVTGTVFGDGNDNGLQDKGEKGLTGTIVRLMNEEGEFASATVDAGGAFKFNALLPGKYALRYELPENAVFAKVVKGGNVIQGDGGVGDGEWFSVGVGDAYAAPLCGGLLLSDIAGFTFGDANGNGVMDADESPLADVRISLVPDRSDLQPVEIVTGADGAFAMTGLRPGTYTLTVTCPKGCVLSRMPGASLGLNHGLNKQSVQLKLDMGTRKLDQQLGCVLPSTWTGEVYLDENYDGKRAANEAPAVGETVILRDAKTGENVLSVRTDENGRFTVEGIAPGEYELVLELDEGCLEPKKGDNQLQHKGSVLTTGPVTIRQNEDKEGTLILLARTTEIGGKVWLETFDSVNVIAGAKVVLLDERNREIAEQTTGEDGSYLFSGLMPGRYALKASIPSGHVLVESSDEHLAEAGLISVIEEANGLNGHSGVIELRMAKHQRKMDIGAVLPGRLGDKVWLDLNGNGLQDGEEGGIPGVTIELMRGDRLMATTVSDQYGYYVFENLYPTTYTLRVTYPAEVVPTLLRTDIGQIVSVLQEDGTSIPVEVESNKANYAADLGFVLVEADKLPAGYGEGETQNWKKK